MPDGGGTGDGSGDSTVSSTCGTTMQCVEDSASIVVGQSGMVSMTTVDFGDATQGSCGGTGAGDFGVQFTVTPIVAGQVRFTVSAPFDTVLYVFQGSDCSGQELACVDNPGASDESYVTDTILIAPRDFVVVADGKNACGPVTITYGL